MNEELPTHALYYRLVDEKPVQIPDSEYPTMEDWSIKNRRVALTFLTRDGTRFDYPEYADKDAPEGLYGLEVSTVFLGIDHNPYFLRTDNAPILFETMVLAYEKNTSDFLNLQWRYTSIEQAREGHARIVERAIQALKENNLELLEEFEQEDEEGENL